MSIKQQIETWPIYGAVRISTFDGNYLNDEVGVDDLKALAASHTRLLKAVKNLYLAVEVKFPDVEDAIEEAENL